MANKLTQIRTSNNKWFTKKTTTTKMTMRAKLSLVIKLSTRVMKFRLNSRRMNKTRWRIILMTRMKGKKAKNTLTTEMKRRKWLRLMKNNLDSCCSNTRESWTVRTPVTQFMMKTVSLFFSLKKSTKRPLHNFRLSSKWIELLSDWFQNLRY